MRHQPMAASFYAAPGQPADEERTACAARARRALIVATALTALATVALPPPAPAASHGRLLFSSTRDGNDEVYTANQDGSGRVNLTQKPGVRHAADALARRGDGSRSPRIAPARTRSG